jgi:peptidoglycan/xylan/chitin deacetylase (PgdA/CDA1 family)
MSARDVRTALSRTVKFTLAQLLFHTGALALVLHWKLRRSAIVLMYHRVLPPDADSFSNPGIVVTPETFALHMRVLRRKLNPLAPREFADTLRAGKDLAPRSCLVTFDDGWFDNHRYALPILRGENVPALIFVATDYIDSSNCFWQERAARLLFAAWRAGDRAAPALAAQKLPPIVAADEIHARRAIAEIVAQHKRLPPAGLATWLDDLARGLAALGIQPDGNGDDRFMRWSEVADLAGSGVVTIGSHACSHRPLSRLDAPSRLHELAESRRLIQARLGRNVDTIAYPDGAHDDATVDAARAAGYQLAFTTIRGTVARTSEPLRLRRVNLAEYGTGTTAEFLCRLAGLF